MGALLDTNGGSPLTLLNLECRGNPAPGVLGRLITRERIAPRRLGGQGGPSVQYRTLPARPSADKPGLRAACEFERGIPKRAAAALIKRAAKRKRA
jgi:hypothetical protein